MAYCDEGIRKGTAQQTAPDLKELLTEYEELEARLCELNERKQQIRQILFGELTTSGVEETSVITKSGTKFVIRIQKVKREKVDVKLLRQELGQEAEKFISVTESEFLSIRPAKKTKPELEDK